MATTTNYGWTTPDDTALVKDGASAIRTLGTSVDTTTKALNPSTTLGDIEYRSSTANTNTRLGIGSTGNVLTVAGGVPSWAAPAGGTTAWTLLNAGGTALTGAGTITVSGITKDKLLIFVKTASSASASSTIKLRFNSDTGTNYTNAQMAMTMEATYAAANFVASSPNDDSFKIGRMPAAATGTVSGYAIVEGCKNVGLNVYYGAGGGSATSSNTQQWFNYGGVYTGAAAITSVDVVSDTGNFDAGTVFVYGA